MDGCRLEEVEAVKHFIDSVGGTPNIMVGEEAVLHLFRVASGIESEIIGENEILRQVKRAWDQSLQLGKTTPLLNELFRHAIMVGKRARRETGISKGKAGYSSVALQIASRLIGGLEGKSVALIGWGSINRKILVSLCTDYSPRRVAIITRHSGSVMLDSTSPECEVNMISYGDKSVDNEFDAVFIAVKGYDVDPYYYEKARVIVDLSTPRRVPLDWRRSKVVDLDRVLIEVRSVIDERKKWVPLVEDIIKDEINKFLYRVALRKASEIIRAIEEYRRALSGGNPEVDRATRKLVHPIYEAIRLGLHGEWSLDSFIDYIYNEYLRRVEGERNASRLPSIKA
ncbi:MAG: hypothetical protein F7C33_03330 [Desulfurococcales archaeon]|nr:hypothetical protein [Desulfurococcales archaeon]